MTTWSTTQLAAALRLTPQRVGQLCKAGILPMPTHGKHDPFVAVPRYIEFLGRRLTGGDLKSARIAKYAVETAIKELDYKQKAGELVEQATVDKDFFRLGREMREGLGNLAPRVSALVANEPSQEKCFQIITREVDQILEALCAQATTDPGSGATRPRPAARRHSRDLASRRG